MEMRLKRSIKTGIIVGTLGAASFTLMAKPTLKTIKAYLNPTISYTLDGEKVLQDAKTITYDNKTYIPLAEAAKLMGMEVKFENNTIMMTTKNQQVIEATIVDIDTAYKRIAVLKKGDENKTENYIVLNTVEQTKIINEEDNKLYRFEDLKKDMMISVHHAKDMIATMPPQTVVYEIKILSLKDLDEQKEANKQDETDKDKESKKEQTVYKNVKILEVNNSAKYILIEGLAKEGGQLKITFDNKTKVKYENVKKQPHANSLKAGLTVDIELEKTVGTANTETLKVVEITVKDK